MGRRMKRGQAGNAAQYLTRTKAIRKLQLRLSEFRRLCILKGIHPREPKKKVQGANKTYYHVKDINWLLHEPLLQVFRDVKAHQRKVRKAHAKFNPELADRLRQLTPTYRLDHLVKERYPTFVDALRDLDDALTMVHLFATLPAEKRRGIPQQAVEAARRLALEWSAWVARSSALRKVFVSVKGIYFQAEVLSQPVTWLVPHQLAQVLPTDVDFKVMVTFLEFYECLLQFVNFKLYHTLGLKYPPVLDQRLEDAAEGLAAVMRELAGVAAEGVRATDSAAAALKAADDKVAARIKALDAEKVAALTGKGERAGGQSAAAQQDSSVSDSEPGRDFGGSDNETVDSEEGEGADSQEEEEEEEEEEDASGGVANGDGGDSAGPNNRAAATDGELVAGGALGEGVAADDDAALCASLFRGLTFFLGREVPREPLALVIRSFGGVAAWDGEGSPCGADDDRITHHVVDRPSIPVKLPARQYVQPQFVFDAANFRVLPPAQLYAPGKVPPPHLSPFVNDDDEGYTPDWALEVKKLQEAARAARMRTSGLALPPGFAEAADGMADDAEAGGAAKDGGDDDAGAAEVAYQAELSKELRAGARKRARPSAPSPEPSVAAQGSEDAEVGEAEESEDEEEGAVAARVKAGTPRGAAAARVQAAADEELLKDVMMTRKTRKLYERIQRAREGKRQRVEVLHERKAALTKRAPAASAKG